ncbi:Zn-dependent oxidoreductase [Lichenibacterium minor]|uniref:Zn-dependent oxidoreductase n=1 Tax=Lichenibacterium minor TaxID=2316528 RepID=UPI001FE1665D|nr:Zn-dependent oxidoreductase [Lichenibacterium minor]
MVDEPNRLRIAAAAPIDGPCPDEVVVRVLRGGICGSDIHILHGSNPFARYPRVIGHEFAGVIEAIGSGVHGLIKGQRVVVDPVVACGHCYPCRIGRPNVCGHLEVFGVHRDGGFRTRLVVPAANCIAIPDGVSTEVATLAEPLSIAANVLSRTGIDTADTVLIYGAGTVGLTVLQVAKLHGARCIVADIDAARLERARNFGADVAIDSSRDDVPTRVATENDGLGPSVVIDGAGIPALLAEACRVASPAGRIGILGFSAAPCPVSQQEIVRKELALFGSRLNRKLLPQVMDWLASGRLAPAAMITQTFAARDARDAFDLVERHPERTVKVHLDFTG